jgi:hypothetical protein|tara:strand:- start:39 stop:215 length:177 start_codon:yes stop_codon:yes gene_type:complete
MSENLSEAALNFIQQFDKAIESKDGKLLGDLLFDAEMDDMQDEIDLDWYTATCSNLME